jgi:hypothetical protein
MSKELTKRDEVAFGEIVRSLKKLERGVNAKGEDIVRLRFEQGCLLKDIVGKSTYGENAVEQIVKETQIPEGTLRVAYGHAKRFNFKEVLLDKEITRLKEAGKSISYGYFRAALKPETNPDLHGGEEKHKEFLLKKVESAGSDLQAAADHYGVDEQVQGAAIGFASAIEDVELNILGNRGTSGTKKGDPWKCPQWLAYLRTLPCCITGEVGSTEAHHLILRSRGAQASDFFCFNLSSEMHREYHKLGHEKFTEKYNVDWVGILVFNWQNFVTIILK